MVLNFVILLAISAAWGFGYLFVKIGERSFTPITEMVGRALVRNPRSFNSMYSIKKGLEGPLKEYKALLVFSVLGVTVPWLGIVFSEETISSGLAAAMASTMPLFTYIITAFVTKSEMFTMYGLTGLLTALIGLILVIGIEKIIGHSSTFMGVLIILGAFLCYATNGVLVPRIAKDIDPLVITTYAIGFGTVILATLAFTFEKPAMTHPDTEAVLSLMGSGS